MTWKMWPITSEYYQKVRVSFEMREKSSQFTSQLWWKFMPGIEVVLLWPDGKVKIRNEDCVLSADPNDHYRPWLEENVGKQGWDWDWKVHGDYTAGSSQLLLKIRRSKAQFATMAALKWK